MSDPSISFNLWYEPWIRVTRLDGSETTLGLGPCLSTAKTLAALSDPSPLVVGGTHRLLTAILQAIYAPANLTELASLLRQGQFDHARLATFAAQYAERFDLFHPTTPFLQTGEVPRDGSGVATKDMKPIAYLFPEVPSATNRSHFHHVTDASHQLCPACCARGITTIPAFASSGGPGIRPSINGVPPIYVLPLGTNLCEALSCSVTSPDFQPSGADPDRSDLVVWRDSAPIQKNHQVSRVGYLESLVFPARRMRLFPHLQAGICTHCGQPTRIWVQSMLFEMGHWLSEGIGIWEDPFVAFRKPLGRTQSNESGPRPVRPEAGKALWREYTVLLLAERDDLLRPRIVAQTAKLIDQGTLAETERVRFRCIGIRTDGKAKFFEWLDEALDVPPTLLNDDTAALLVEDALRWANELERLISFTFDQHFRPQRSRADRVDQRVVRFKSLRARMLTDYWSRLAPQFRHFVADLAIMDERDQLARTWADRLVREGNQAFEQAAAQIGSHAEALRARVEAQAECRRRLHHQRKEWFNVNP